MTVTVPCTVTQRITEHLIHIETHEKQYIGKINVTFVSTYSQQLDSEVDGKCPTVLRSLELHRYRYL